MKMLLVWEIVPEDVNCYVLDPNSEQAQWARDSAGKYLNSGLSEDDDTIYKLNDWLVTEAAENSIVDNDKPIIGPFSEVVVCGFVM